MFYILKAKHKTIYKQMISRFNFHQRQLWDSRIP